MKTRPRRPPLWSCDDSIARPGRLLLHPRRADSPLRRPAALRRARVHLPAREPRRCRGSFRAAAVARRREVDKERSSRRAAARLLFERPLQDEPVLARCGNLLFFALAAFATWAWARRELGEPGAAVAIFLFTFQPMILGHAGLATHDMAATAGPRSRSCCSCLAREPTIKRAMLFGAAFGFAILCKFLLLGYVPPRVSLSTSCASSAPATCARRGRASSGGIHRAAVSGSLRVLHRRSSRE